MAIIRNSDITQLPCLGLPRGTTNRDYQRLTNKVRVWIPALRSNHNLTLFVRKFRHVCILYFKSPTESSFNLRITSDR
jgi:hypothetical protein